MNCALSPYADHEFIAGTHNNSWANLFAFVPDGARVLDVGCSTGNFGKALIHEKGCSVVGVDNNPGDISLAREVLTEARVLDIDDPLPKDFIDEFDVVIFADVLEHLPDPRSTLRRIKPALRPDGFAVYSIPNMAHLSIRLDLLSGVFPYTETGLLDKTHFHFYDRVEVSDIFFSAGYLIVDENPVIVQYPNSWIRDRLGQLGLDPREGFFDLALSTFGQVFQFVGVARPSHSESVSVPLTRTRAMPNDEIIGYIQALIDEKARAEDKAFAAQQQLSSSQEEASYFESSVNYAYQHPIRNLIRTIVRGAPSRE